MMDLEYAKESFRQYLNHYDRSDDKIMLKEVHTFCVLDAADYICREEKISKEDHELAHKAWERIEEVEKLGDLPQL